MSAPSPGLLVDALLLVLLAAGSGFVLVGSIGLVKLSTFFKRLHGPTKATTLGVGCILIASIGYHAQGGGLGLRELLITAFLFLTAPISAHLMARAALQLDPAQRPAQPAPGEAAWSDSDASESTGAAAPKSDAAGRDAPRR